MPSNLATAQADTLHRGSCEQIASFCESVAEHYHDGMDEAEINHFARVASSLRAVLAMQSSES